jgi:hypothetical protein
VDVPSRIKPELAHMFERALRDEADGKSIVMRELHAQISKGTELLVISARNP